MISFPTSHWRNQINSHSGCFGGASQWYGLDAWASVILGTMVSRENALLIDDPICSIWC
jgi:hypothetical protein